MDGGQNQRDPGLILETASMVQHSEFMTGFIIAPRRRESTEV